MVSSHASQVGRNRAAQYHRTVNPAPQRLRKAPERVWRLRKAPERVYAHRLTVAHPTAPAARRWTHLDSPPAQEIIRLRGQGRSFLQIVAELDVALATASLPKLRHISCALSCRVCQRWAWMAWATAAADGLAGSLPVRSCWCWLALL